MKHTPDSRVVERADAESGEIYYAVHAAKDYEFIANFDKEGDALLDAAAPDLLEACRYIVEAGETGDEMIAIEKALAAIAKATQRS